MWHCVTSLRGVQQFTFSELIEALESLGVSEGALDGVTDWIDESGLVEITEDLDYRTRSSATGDDQRFLTAVTG